LPGVCHTKNPSRRERYDSVDRTFFDHGRRICGVAQLTPSLIGGPKLFIDLGPKPIMKLWSVSEPRL
jgi:hypothetical protein